MKPKSEFRKHEEKSIITIWVFWAWIL